MPNAFSSSYAFDPRVTYLNHGAFGAIPRVVQATHDVLRAQIARNPIAFFHRDYTRLLDESRAALSSYVGTVPESLAFVGNASEGISAILSSIAWQPGDEIITTSLGYDSVDNAVQALAVVRGAVHKKVRIALPVHSTAEIEDAICATVSSKTRLVVIDHIASRSAIVLPVQSLCVRLSALGVEVLVDGAHAPGQLALNVDAIGADYYVGNAHKWLSAPRGTAFVVAKERARAGLHALTVSHGATWNRPNHSRFHDEFDWTGTRDYSAWLSVASAIAFLERANGDGASGIRAASVALREHAVATLEATGAVAVAPPSAFASMATVELGQATTENFARIVDQVIHTERTEVTLVRDADRVFLRFCIWLYNSRDDVDKMVRAIRTTREQRWLL